MPDAGNHTQSSLERGFATLAAWVVSHRSLAAAVLMVVVALPLVGLFHLQIDFSARAFFGAESEALQEFDAYREVWGTQDNVLLVTSWAEDTPGVLTKDRLRALESLRVEVEALDETLSAEGISNVPRLIRGGLGAVMPVPLRATLPADDARAEQWRSRLLSDPTVVPNLLSRDGRASAMVVTLVVPEDDIAAVRPAVEAVEAVLVAHQGQLGLTHATAGLPAVRAGFMRAVVDDQLMFVCLGLLVIASLLGVMFRRVHGVVIPLLAGFVPVVMLYGTLGWTGVPVGVVNQVFTTLIPVIAVADAIHMVARFHEEQRRRGEPGTVLSAAGQRAAVIAAMTHVGSACLLTTMTTAVGFLSLGLASMPILRSFGFYAALGIGYAYLTVLLIVPLCLSWTRSPVRSRRTAGAADRMLLAVAQFSTRRWRLVLVVAALVVAVMVGFGTRTVVNNRLTSVLDPDHPTSVGNQVVDQSLGGLMAVEVGLRGDLHDRETLAAVYEAAERARGLPEVRAVIDPGTVLASVAQMLGAAAEVPESQDTVDTLLAASGDRLGGLIQRDRDAGRMLVRVRDVGAVDFVALETRLQEALNPPLEAAGLAPVLTGTPVIGYAGINAMTRDLRSSLSAAFGIVVLLISLLFRSFRVGALSILPNALPILIGYGFMGAMALELDPGPAVVFTIALGLAVDDTIHLLVRYREERRHVGHLEAIHAAVRHTGRAVWITSVVLGSGFAINVMSSFPPNRTFGLVGAVIIFSALFADLMVLPALLAAAGPGRSGSGNRGLSGAGD